MHLPSGAGYGFKISRADRDRYFKRTWKSVIVELPKENGSISVEVNIRKESFWNTCLELIHQEIGRWLLETGHAPWKRGNPPKFVFGLNGERTFILE